MCPPHVLNCVRLFVTPWTVDHQALLSMEFCKQEYWSGLTSPFPGHLPKPGIESASLVSPTLVDGFFTIPPLGKPNPVSSNSQESSPTPEFKSINSVVFSLLYGPIFISIHDYGKKHMFNYTDIRCQSDVSVFQYAI